MSAPLINARDQQLIIIAFQCLDMPASSIKVDLPKFTQMGGYKNTASASVIWRNLKKKLLETDASNISAAGAGNASEGGGAAGGGTPGGSGKKGAGRVRKRAAAADGDDEEGMESPVQKKKRAGGGKGKGVKKEEKEEKEEEDQDGVDGDEEQAGDVVRVKTEPREEFGDGEELGFEPFL